MSVAEGMATGCVGANGWDVTRANHDGSCDYSKDSVAVAHSGLRFTIEDVMEVHHWDGNRVFGCDICQEVCPWNRRFARPIAEPAFQPRSDAMAPPLLGLIALDDKGFRRRFRCSPVRRVKRRGLLRNVAVALGNWGDPVAVPALARALSDAKPLIRGHVAWALGRIATGESRRALEHALVAEPDEWVQEELRLALEAIK